MLFLQFVNRKEKESKYLPTSISYKTSKAALNMCKHCCLTFEMEVCKGKSTLAESVRYCSSPDCSLQAVCTIIALFHKHVVCFVAYV